MWNYRNICKAGETRLKSSEIEEASLDARLLLEYVMETDRNFLFAHGDADIPEEKAEKYLELIEKRAVHIPLQHLTGVQEFMGLDFYVNEHVLIPRQDTECLVEEAMIEIMDGMKVLDMCTGSGCILISLMKYKNGLSGTAVDVSEDALLVARRNAAHHEVPIEFVKSDLFAALPVPEVKFDAVVSNPPYIRSDVVDTLMEEVREHEPRLALDGKKDGLYFYRSITEQAGNYLVHGGKLLFEIGFDQGEQVKELLCENGFDNARIVKDLSGNDRVVCGTYAL